MCACNTAGFTCRKVDLAGDEIVHSVLLPWTQPLEIVRAYKQAHRREDDIALVNACMRARFARASSRPSAPWVVQEASLAFGGVGPRTVVCQRTSEALTGRVLDHEAVQVSRLLLVLAPPPIAIGSVCCATLQSCKPLTPLCLSSEDIAGQRCKYIEPARHQLVTVDTKVKHGRRRGIGLTGRALRCWVLLTWLVVCRPR
jgi:CO dehydrogenase flavoprotein C-terminal domain